jgi:S1-C subfamily serine protease
VLSAGSSATADNQAALVDAATVRVFSIGTVGIEKFELPQGSLSVADPHGGHGTGFLTAAGVIVTAAHVIESARHVVVRLPGTGGFFPAQVVFSDKDADTAVLFFDEKTTVAITPLVLSNKSPQVRQPVFAVGYPLDASRSQPQSARGIIAGMLDNGTIQVDMALNPGNSGGPIVDENNEVVAMAVARGDVSSGVQGIGFAVPLAKIKAALEEAERRRNTGQIAELSTGNRLGAVIVDELVQQGALRQITKAEDVRVGLIDSKVEKTLSAMITRIDDPDLLVYVAGQLWNVSLALWVASPEQLQKAGLTDEQSKSLAQRLRSSAVSACQKAVKVDSLVAQRSAFVTMVLSAGSTGSSRDPSQAWVVRAPQMMVQTEFAFNLAMQLRLNPEVSTLTVGYGFGAEFRLGKSSGALMDLQVASVTQTKDGDSLRHRHYVGDVGYFRRLGARHKLELNGSLGLGIYSLTSVSKGVETSIRGGGQGVVSFRLGAEYYLGPIQLGIAARALNGPIFWVEPLHLGFRF